MPSVINFALAAPVVVQEHGVRVSEMDVAKDGTATSPPSLRRDLLDKWLENAADWTNGLPIPRSSDSGHWQEEEPMQHNLRSRTDSNGSPEPSNPAPPMDPHANGPSPSPPLGPGSTSHLPKSSPTGEPYQLNTGTSTPHGNTDSISSPYQGQGPTDNSDNPHALNPASPSDSRPLNPGQPHRGFDSNSVPETPGISQTSSSREPEVSSSHSGSSSSPSSQQHVSPQASLPGSSQDRVPSRPSLEDSLLSGSQSSSSGEPSGEYYSSALEQSSTEESTPSSPSQFSTEESTPSSPSQFSTDESHPQPPGAPHGDINADPHPWPSSLKFKSLSEILSTPYVHGTLPPDSSPQSAPSPDGSHSPSSKNPHSGSSSPSSSQHVLPPASFPESSQDRVPSRPNLEDNLLSDSQSFSSGETSGEYYSSALEQPSTDESNPSSESMSQFLADDSHPLNPALPHGDLDIDSAPQPSHPKYKSLSEILSTPAEHDSPPPSPAGSPQTALLPDGSHSSNPPVPVAPHDPSSLSSGSPATLVSEPQHLTNPPLTEESYPSSPEQLSTAESRPPTLGPTDNHPLPASSLNPGPSTEANPAPSAKRPRPEDPESESSLSKISKIFKGKLKRRFSGSDALDSAQGYLQESFTVALRRTSLHFPSLSCQQTTVVINILSNR